MSDLGRFHDDLDAKGADLARWPEQERIRAEALLARSDDARAALRAAEAFERVLMDAEPEAPRERLRRNILAALPAPGVVSDGMPAGRHGGGSLRWLRAGGFGAAAASLALSFYLGTASPTLWPDQTATADEAADLAPDFDSVLFGIGFEET